MVGVWFGGRTLGGGWSSLDMDWSGVLGGPGPSDLSTKSLNSLLPFCDSWIISWLWNLVCPCLGLCGGGVDQNALLLWLNCLGLKLFSSMDSLATFSGVKKSRSLYDSFASIDCIKLAVGLESSGPYPALLVGGGGGFCTTGAGAFSSEELKDKKPLIVSTCWNDCSENGGVLYWRFSNVVWMVNLEISTGIVWCSW